MWLTLEEVAEHLRVSKETAYKLAQRGRLPGTKVGSQWRFHKDLLEQALVSATQSSLPSAFETSDKPNTSISASRKSESEVKR